MLFRSIGQGFLFSRPLPYERFEAWLSVQTEPVPADAASEAQPAQAAGETGPEVRRLRAVP